jgi:hypothetical protein
LKEQLPVSCTIFNNAPTKMAAHPDAKEANFVNPTTTAIGQASSSRSALLGHGSLVNILDPIIKEILEEQYQKGIIKSSNRKEVLEMVKCMRDRSSHLVVSKYQLSERLAWQ